ncbi:MAG: putative membrane protein [Oceanospirillaceae bacterium]|jgi:putative membrane protein
MKFITSIKSLVVVTSLAVGISGVSHAAESPADLNDLQIAHVAYTADNIDIRYAHLALALTQDPNIRSFAQTMIRDHSAVNKQALALLKKLQAQPQDNFLSQHLTVNSEKLINQMSQLRGAAFDKFYANNELAYHKAVNKLVEFSFIPNIENGEVKALFGAGLEIFKAHQQHAQVMVDKLNAN